MRHEAQRAMERFGIVLDPAERRYILGLIKSGAAVRTSDTVHDRAIYVLELETKRGIEPVAVVVTAALDAIVTLIIPTIPQIAYYRKVKGIPEHLPSTDPGVPAYISGQELKALRLSIPAKIRDVARVCAIRREDLSLYEEHDVGLDVEAVARVIRLLWHDGFKPSETTRKLRASISYRAARVQLGHTEDLQT